jgi:hypothetical protein
LFNLSTQPSGALRPQDADLLEHAHQVVEQILLHDFPLFVPACNRAEINVKLLVSGLNESAIRHAHGPLHRAGEVGNGAGPLALTEPDLVWIIDEVLVREHFKKRNGFLLMRFPAVGRGLIRPAHNAVFGVIAPEGCEILRVPRVVQIFHVLQIFGRVHIRLQIFDGCL